MKIIIATVQIPFIMGGAEFLASNLKNALIKQGHEAEIVSIPFMDNPVNLIEDHIVASRLLYLEQSWAGKTDLCIGLKFPGYYIPHPNKVIWALHQYRAAYEFFNTDYSNLKDNIEGNRIKNIVVNADNIYLNETERIFTISKNVAARMKKYNGINASALYHPCPDMDKYFSGGYEDYILMPSRINITKRQLLAVEAMSFVKSDIKLCIVGHADNSYEYNRMTDLIKKHKLQNRVKCLDYVSLEEKLKLYANARAVLFIPFDEDYGYITLEAMAASKAVITTTDSGGPLEFIQDGKTGMITDPNAKEIAKAMDALAGSPALAETLGKAANRHLRDMDITWGHVIKELAKQ